MSKITTRKIEPHVWNVYDDGELLGVIEKREHRAQWRAVPANNLKPVAQMPRSRTKAIHYLRMAKAANQPRDPEAGK